jgi:hypothetical protein
MPRLIAATAVSTTPLVMPCSSSATKTHENVGRVAKIKAEKAMATIPIATNPRFQRTASANAPPGICIITPATPPAVST